MDRAQRAIKFRSEREMMIKAEKDWKAIEDRREEERQQYLANRQKLLDKGFRYGSTLRRIVHKEKRFEKDVDDGSPKLLILLRCDVEGTLEAILNVTTSYDSKKCVFQIVDFGIGPPTNMDVDIAKDTGAVIYLFNVQPSVAIRNQAEQDGVRIEYFNVIYRLVEALKNELSQRLPMLTEMELVGEGHVLKPIAGVLVDWGFFDRDCIFKFTRGEHVVYEGTIVSMKQQADIVSSAKTNTEVGIAVEDKSIRFKEDDTVKVYNKRLVPQTIDWHPLEI
ncbi:hypothetical protein DICVIV_12452 [Dictyocaulus viviparus]|uniref:Translation initiation factor IF- 2 domain-containing protein n=1 Tax=Dictyocaulus viviparus TaxID=29172 RepID=A0A0D8XAE6_DICVI|nr:hypothetical protein DICVIV_12452 [Dictyocaulus viviparus]